VTAPRYDVVVPTLGRPSLAALLGSLAAAAGPLPERIVLVDDRARADAALEAAVPGELDGRVTVLAGGGRGPAAARNLGWRAGRAEWVAFLDDDVVVDGDWRDRLVADLADLARLGDRPAGSQGRVRVPLPAGRAPTDWERNVAGLERARWATADLAYRRAALEHTGGFDERFPRAYREDAELGLRLVAAGWTIARGARTVAHPVRPADRWVSVRLQRGNADDALMRALHGRGWRERAGVPRGRRRRHLATVAAGAAGLAGALAGRPALAAAGAAAWAAGTAELAWARIAPGPRTRDEVLAMAATSAVLPVAATVHWLRGWLRAARLLAACPPPLRSAGDTSTGRVRGAGDTSTHRVRRVGDDSGAYPSNGGGRRPAAVLFDRDGTLVVDVPYNGDPDLVRPAPGARAALERLRAAGVPTAVISNQSGIGRGLLTRGQVAAVNARIERLLGPVGPWLVCPHAPGDGCACRKPSAGLVLQAAAELGVDPARCAVVGDIGADVEAARAAGARPVLVPTAQTLPEEVAAAPEVAADLGAAVDLLLGESRR